jgi:hypothetical protein
MYDRGIIVGGCPHCEGDLEWWDFDGDCRGSPPFKGSKCSMCNFSSDMLPSNKSCVSNDVKDAVKENLKGFERCAGKVLRKKVMKANMELCEVFIKNDRVKDLVGDVFWTHPIGDLYIDIRVVLDISHWVDVIIAKLNPKDPDSPRVVILDVPGTHNI